MIVLNASPWPSTDAHVLNVKCTDRSFWSPSVDVGSTTPLPDGAVPVYDEDKLKVLCDDVNQNFNSTLIFDIEFKGLVKSTTSSPLFNLLLDELQALIDKTHANGVKHVSLWGLPFSQAAESQYRVTLDAWEANTAALKPALDKCDFLCPKHYAAGNASAPIATDRQAMNECLWRSMAAYTVGVALKNFPGKPIFPCVSGRGGLEGTDFHYLPPPYFLHLLAFERAMPGVAGVVLWDAAFDPQSKAWTNLKQMPLYPQLAMAAYYEPIWPTDGNPQWGV